MRVLECLILHKLVVIALPGPITAQPLDARVGRCGPVLKRYRPAEQVRVLLPQRLYLLHFHGGAEEAGAFPWLRKPGPLNYSHALLAGPAPNVERIVFLVLLVRFINGGCVLDAPGLSGIVADELMDALAAGPHILARLVVVAELFLRADLVLEGAALETIGNGWEGPAVDALLFQR